MKISNKHKVSYYSFFLTLVNLTLIFGIIFFILERTVTNVFGNTSIIFLLVALVLLLIYILRGKEIFEYDSEGEAVHFINNRVFPFFNKEIRDEFPKYKIKSFEIINFFGYKRLFIELKTKKEKKVLLKYDISYLTKTEIKNLKFSLKKIVAENKEQADN